VTQVFWTPQAQDDLDAIFEYISETSAHYAVLVVNNLLAATSRLERFPESGRMVPERHRPELREVLWRSYRIVYRHLPERSQVHVLTVFRGERRFPDDRVRS
jgi:plasmid stabilization system protein ParE